MNRFTKQSLNNNHTFGIFLLPGSGFSSIYLQKGQMKVYPSILSPYLIPTQQ